MKKKKKSPPQIPPASGDPYLPLGRFFLSFFLAESVLPYLVRLGGD